MGKRRKKKVAAEETAVETAVLPESPASPDSAGNSFTVEENTIENPTQTTIEVEESFEETVVEVPVEDPAPPDPRYTLLFDSLKSLVDVRPTFRAVAENPWLYLEWSVQVANLVK